jgi:hypothetical protein
MAKELQGEELKCSVCRKGFVDRRVVHAGASGLVLVEAKKWLEWWRRVIFRRIDPPYHSQVVHL